MRKTRKILSVLLAVIMMLGTLPAPVYAAEESGIPAEESVLEDISQVENESSVETDESVPEESHADPAADMASETESGTPDPAEESSVPEESVSEDESSALAEPEPEESVAEESVEEMSETIPEESSEQSETPAEDVPTETQEESKPEESLQLEVVPEESKVEVPAEVHAMESSLTEESKAEEAPVFEESKPEETKPFEQSAEANGVIVTVKAPEGVFPDNAVLHVEAVTTKAAENAEAAAEDQTAANKAVSFTFDIKVLDKDGNEIQPNTDKGEVSVTFAMAAPVKYDDVEVYHVENNAGTEVKSLDTTVEENGEQIEATAKTDGFSLFVVQFIYHDMEFDLTGYGTVALSEILAALGIEGEVASAVSSNPYLFSVEKNSEGEWTVYSYHSFETEETLTLEIGNATYVIDVFDPVMSKEYASFGNNSDISFDTYIYADDARWLSGTAYANYGSLQIHKFDTGEYMYCIETGADSTGGHTYSDAQQYAANLVNKIKNNYPTTYSQLARVAEIATTLMSSSDWSSYSDADIAGAAQVIVWELISGARSSFTVGSTTWVYNKIDAGSVSTFQTIYAEIVRQMANWDVIPSFAGTSASVTPITLNYNSTSKKWTATVTDSNSVYSAFSSLGTSGTVPGTSVTYSVSGNSVTFTADAPFSEKVVSSALYKFGSGSTVDTIVGYGDTSVSGGGRSEGQVLIGATGVADVAAYLAFKMDVSSVSLKKSSSSTASCYTNNPMYSLEGAVYGVYASQADARADQNRLDTLTTNASGNASSNKLYAVGQTVYVKEITAPAGYRLDAEIHSLTITANAASNVFDVKDVPVADPIGVILMKVGAKSGTQIATDLSLAGAEYTVKYYTNATATGTPNATWVFKTDANGRIQYSNAYKVSGPDLYTRPDTEQNALPLGSITIQETKAPANFQINNTVYKIVIQLNSNGGTEKRWIETPPEVTLANGNKFSPKAGDLAGFAASGNTVLFVTAEEEETGSLKITKEVERGEVSDVDRTFTFTVTGPDSYSKDVTITVKKGETTASATLDNLFLGSYTVTEKATGDGANYTRPASQTKDVKAGEETPFNFTGKDGNKIPRGTLVINKEIKPGNVVMDKDTVFTFNVTGTYALGGTYNKTVTVTIPKGQLTGSATISDLPYGTYTVSEAPNASWNIVGDQTKTINDANKSQTFNFTANNANTPKLGSLVIKKEIQPGATAPKEDITFTFTVTGTYDLGGTYSGTATVTIPKGQLTGSTTINDLPYGSYVVTEAENATWNIVGPKTDKISEANPKPEFKFTDASANTPKLGSLTITKEAEDEDYLPDVFRTFTFNVHGDYTIGGTYDKQITITIPAGQTTASETITNLPYGTYTVSEQKNANYKVVSDKTATLKDGATTASFSFTADDKNLLERGNAKVIKVDRDYTEIKLTGAEFDVYNADTDKKVGSMTETSEGMYELTDLPYGNYYAVETKAPDYYILSDEHIEFSLTPQAPEAEIEVANEPQIGEIRIEKKIEDTADLNYDVDVMALSGFSFRIQGTTKTGIAYDRTYRTDDEGKIKVERLRIGTYTVTELETGKTTPFVIPEEQEKEVTTDTVITYTFENIYKKWNLTVTKVDAEGIERSDAKLSGAKYGIYKDGVLVDEYTTDAEGKFTTKDYICDDDWTLAEIEPSEGYLLNTDVVDLGTEATLYTANIELNTAEGVTSPEDVIKGVISLIKHTDEGITKIETPEEGAEFEVYIKSAGSYADASDEERDLLVTDENGFAETKELPYGVYVVHQTKSWPGRELMEDYEVYINKDGMRDFKLINNANFYAHVKVMKKDAETEETIPYAGAKFQIFYTDGDLAGEKVAIEVTYPEHIVIDTFQTNSKGEFITPVELPYGKYTLVEVEAPYGYVLDPTPVPFEVTEEQAEQEATIEVIKVTKFNTAQKGTITVTKTGEVFSSVAEEGGFYVPKYAEGKLQGAEFTVKAAEDIVTPDGTVRAKKGDVVAVITTGEDGTATTDPLYLGKYTVEETKAPYGMILNEEVHDVELTYAGQEVDVTSASDSFTNERQKFELSILKEMQADEDGNIDLDAALLNVEFSLYAREEMVAADGLSSEGTKTIPADGLLAQASPDEEGKIVFNVDLPVDAKVYVKETATDSHYILDEGEYDLTAEYAGQDEDVVELVFNDGDPVVNIPVEIKTTLFGTEDVSLDEDGKTVSAYETVTLIDCVEYTGLVVGKEYTVTGTLMDKATCESFKDEDGNEIIASETFIAETVDGFVDITFTFPGVLVSEKTTLVAFEEVTETETEKEVAVHTDIEDEDQTVTVEVPKIGTTAAIEGEKVACSTGKMILTDIVAYENLVPGTYKLKTKVYDKTKGELTDWTGETVFEVTEKDGTVSVEIIISALDLTEDSEFVVFESLYRINKDEETEEETEEPVTDHENPDDEDQTFEILVPEIGTKATINDLKVVYANETTILADVVAYKNLAPGKYILRAEVYDKNAKELTGWTGELEFTVTEKYGEVTVEIEIDASTITEETSLVVFEYLFRLTDDEENPEEPVTEHEDEEDEDQTVTFEIPEVEVSKKAINGTDELPGAVLIIRDKDGKEIEKWSSTDETHAVTLPVGEYTLTELTAPKDYLVAETISFRVSVNDKNEVQVSVLEDEEYALQDGTLIEMFDAHKPEIEVSKKAINGTEELPGATLTIFDLEGKAVESWVSGEETHKVILEPGEYYLEEVTAPDGYLVAETIFFKVDTDRETGEYVLEIKVDDEYVKQDGTLVEMFDIHKPVVQVSKKELNGTDELPGAELIIKDKDGNIVDKWTSGEEPHEVTLNPGKYYLEELTAPEGYLIAERIDFKVDTDRETGEYVLEIEVDEEYVKQDDTLIVMLDRHEPMMHTTVSANGKVSTDGKHAEIVQSSDKNTVAVKDTVYYEFFVGGSYLLEGKLVKVEKDGSLVIVKEASVVVEAKEYEAGEWVLDFGEIQLENGKYVVFEKATPVTVEEKENPENPDEKIEEVTPTGEPISHENPEDESQTFVITNVPATGDSLKVVPYLLLLAVSGTGVVLLTKKHKTKA